MSVTYIVTDFFVKCINMGVETGKPKNKKEEKAGGETACFFFL